ncbi:MAG: hypothetical protein LBQ86_06080 [Holophagales bacterium]|jgi:chromosome segregation ATPase|nr:hypothetical protein [Holophagales bacterium]
MKTLNTAAVIILAGAGCTAQAQTYAQQFQAVKPELDKLMASMQYEEVIKKIQALIPAEIPAFASDPANPQVALNSYTETATIQDFYDILYRARLMSGDTEGAIATIKKAEEIAKQNAVDTEAALSPVIETWSNAIQESIKNLEEAAPVREQLEARKNKLEAKKSKNKKDRTELEEIQEDMAGLQNSIAVWENNLKMAPDVISHLNRYIDGSKRDAGKFAQDIKDMETDLDLERAEIEKLGNDKAKYVDAVLNTKDNFANRAQKDVVRILNRLLFLAPNNSGVQKQLDTALKAE